jgi:hypothetical protein
MIVSAYLWFQGQVWFVLFKMNLFPKSWCLFLD